MDGGGHLISRMEEDKSTPTPTEPISISGSEYDSESAVGDVDVDIDREDDGDLPATYPYMNSDDSSSGEDGDTSEDSDSDEDRDPREKTDLIAYDAWLTAVNPVAPVVTLDSDEEEVITNKFGQMQCLRCPEGVSIYKDKGLFLLHRERHKGMNHFVCPTCSKPFIKISFCFAHEVRKHGMDFPLQNPAIAEAVRYRKQKLEWERAQGDAADKPAADADEPEDNPEFDDGMDPDFFDDVEPPPIKQTLPRDIIKTKYCTNFAGLVLFPEEGELETDEDDAKFYTDHAVPSTALYPYRGLEPLSMYDCYEIHLRFGRKKRTAANTIARCAMARRRRLIEEGRIAADDMGRFWKPPAPIQQRPIPAAASKRKRGAGARYLEDPGAEWETSSSTTSTSITITQTGGKKRKALSEPFDNSDEELLAQEEEILQRKRRRIAQKNKQATSKSQLDLSNRTFVAGIIARTCLLCGFSWTSETELKTHRDEKHPKKTLVELMTLVKGKKTVKKKPVKAKETASQIPPKRKKRKVQHEERNNTPGGPTDLSEEPLFTPILPPRVRTEKEHFLFTLGLITPTELAHIASRKPVPRGKLCYIHMTNLPVDVDATVKLFACPDEDCDYFSKSKDLVVKHIGRKHTPDEEDYIASSSSRLSAKLSSAKSKYLQLCRSQFVWQ